MLFIIYCLATNANKTFSCGDGIHYNNAVIFAIGLLSGEQTQIIQNYGFIPNHIFNAYDDGNNNTQQIH